MKYLAIVALVLIQGCATGGTNSQSSDTQYIRNTQGQTIAKIRDGNVYQPNGIRTHRIDSSGNIYSVTGPTAGQRVGKIK